MFVLRWLSRPAPYQQTWDAMRDFTANRTETTPDQIWLVEHDPVYTLGQAGRPEHILDSADIPVIACDRGGQVTYHGPGQLVAYCLIDLRRYGLYVKEYVALLEAVLIDLLHDVGLAGARTVRDAPGVYVPVTSVVKHKVPLTASDATRRQPCSGPFALVPDAAVSSSAGDPFSGLAKISALGIKVHRGCTYHGLALNVDMDLTPFTGINPCGYQGVPTTDLRSCGVSLTMQQVGDTLAARLKDAMINYGKRSGDLQS